MTITKISRAKLQKMAPEHYPKTCRKISSRRIDRWPRKLFKLRILPNTLPRISEHSIVCYHPSMLYLWIEQPYLTMGSNPTFPCWSSHADMLPRSTLQWRTTMFTIYEPFRRKSHHSFSWNHTGKFECLKTRIYTNNHAPKKKGNTRKNTARKSRDFGAYRICRMKFAATPTY